MRKADAAFNRGSLHTITGQLQLPPPFTSSVFPFLQWPRHKPTH